MSIPVDDKRHELKLGSSFDPQSKLGFHSIRYDFQPASVDTSKEACVEVGMRNQVTVTVPHIEGSGLPYTVFKGNKQPVMKECVLIIDHDRGTYTFEKLSSKVNLKKTRVEGSSRATQHISGRVTPVDTKKINTATPTKTKKTVKVQVEEEPPSLPLIPDSIKAEEAAAVEEMSDSSYSSSDDEMEVVNLTPVVSASKGLKKPQLPLPPPPPPPPPRPAPVKSYNVLDNDLALSESGSDSDDD